MANDDFLFVKEIGANIARYREMRNLSQQELADRIDLSKSMIVKTEAGGSLPSSVTLSKLSKALGVPVSYLLHLSGGKNEVKEIDERELLKNLLAVFQYSLESNNFLRKSPESITSFAQTRNEDEARAYIAAMALRLAQIQGYEFVIDPNYRAALGVKLQSEMNELLAQVEKSYKSSPKSKKKHPVRD
jgi:transcriptional regulator with XRE-family HTH domain